MNKAQDMSPELEKYLLDKGVSESPEAKELREVTQQHEYAVMMSSPSQVQLITLLLKLIKARRIIEVGVFTGYSTLRMAEAIEEDGRIFACDISEQWMKTGQPFWEKAGVNHKISPFIASAEKSLKQFLMDGMASSFDLIYIDADKTGYETYYTLAKSLVRVGGLVLLDNTLQDGKVAEQENQTENVVAIRSVNTMVSEDPEMDHVLLPIGDGLTIAMKKQKA